MTPERWERVKTVYDAACARPHRERSTFLSRECHGDSDLQLEVEALLQHEPANALALFDAVLRQLTDFGRRATFIARRLSWASDSRSIFAAVGEGESDVVLLAGVVAGSDRRL